MAHRPRSGQIWTVAGPRPRRIVVYSGNMLNDIPDEHVITMDVVDVAGPLSVQLPAGGAIRFTWLGHERQEHLVEHVGDVPTDLMSTVNTRLFMVISTS
ncbi:MAG: hypothetical protein ACRDQF_01720 [Thermocrispum sp.]